MNMGMVEQAGDGWDGNLNGGDDYGNIIDLFNVFDFPPEFMEGDDFVDDFDASKMGPIPSDALTGLLPGPQSIIYNDSSNAAFKHKASVDSTSPQHIQLLNNDDKNSNRTLLAQNKYSDGMFQTQSPVSVLESSASCSGGKTGSIKTDFINVPVRTRTKRTRSSTINPWLLISPISSTTKKKRERKFSQKPMKDMRNTHERANDASDGAIKRCTHCEVTKTPQWREGPLGPKTLCNACGVRYRSGRLFPEYRPAASPTFVPSLHSNSHRKVIEMRKNVMDGGTRIEDSRNKFAGKSKKAFQESAIVEEPPMSPIPEFVPMSSYLFDCI